MSNVRLNCPHCEKIVEAPVELAGSVVSCPHCRGAFDLQIPKGQPQTGTAETKPGATEIVLCPACQKQLQIPVELAGHAVRCPLCQHQFTLPSKITPETKPEPIPTREIETPSQKASKQAQKVAMHVLQKESEHKPEPEVVEDENPATPAVPEKKSLKLSLMIPIVIAVIAILGVVIYFSSRPKSGAQAKAEMSDDQMFTQVVKDYPGWVGSAKLDDGTTILAASADDASAMYSKLNSYRELAVSMVAFRAKPGSAPCTIDPATATFSVGEMKVKGLLHTDVISTMQKTDPWIQYLKGPVVFQPGKVGDCGMIFYLNCLPNFDLNKTTAINVTVNGNPVTINGSYMTLEEKKANIKSSSDSAK